MMDRVYQVDGNYVTVKFK